LISSHRLYRVTWQALFGLALSLLALAAMSTAANAKKKAAFSHGAVFTETNAVPNDVLAFDRKANGGLKLVGKFATGGNGHANNPLLGFPTLDSAGPVGASPSRNCLFAVNGGSNTVSSFRLTSKGLKLVNHPSTGGDRPISLTSAVHGSKTLLYVLNSNTNDATINGYTVAPSCRLSHLAGSKRQTSTPTSVPAQIRFDARGKVLAVSERLANDIDIFPVNHKGVAGAPVVNATSPNKTPYSLAWSNRDMLAVTNEEFPPPAVANSTVTTYRLKKNGKLVALATAPSGGAACWGAFTSTGKALFTSNAAGPLFGGHNEDSFLVGHNGSLTPVDNFDTLYNSNENELTLDDKYLYVLEDMLLPTGGPHGAIQAFKVNTKTGKFSLVGTTQLTTNSLAGLVVF
jgi:6-phosphogluconolactonase (cycloisomerase 2 family)